MSFGGSVAAMIASLKANARPKRNPFNRDLPSTGQAVRSELLREACPEDIGRVREKMAIQRRRERIIIIVGAVLFGSVIIWALVISAG